MASQYWCITINNPTEEDYEWTRNTVCTYIIAGKEHFNAEGQTPHLQVYVEYASKKRFSTLKNELVRGHIELRRGSSQQASDYCKKEDPEPYIRGTLSKSEQGRRSDLMDAAASIQVGASWREIALAHTSTFIRYHKGLEKFKQAIAEQRTSPPTVIWLWGKTGTGKTRTATECPSYYIKDNTKWWDGYENQTRIIIDDLDFEQWNFRDLLRVLDRYSYQGQTKGGYVTVNSPEIYVTCEFPPGEVTQIDSKRDQLIRRISEIRQLQ